MKRTIFILLIATLGLTSCSNFFPAAAAGYLYRESNVAAYWNSSVTENSSSDDYPVLLFGIGMHIEPQGTTHQGYTSGKGDFGKAEYYDMQSKNIQTVVTMINSHGGKVTIQAQSPFTDEVIAKNDTILKELASAGNEIALHFHEDAHLGKNPEKLPVKEWCNVMKEEIDLVKKASGVQGINYWSGGNLYPDVFEAASCAGLSVNSDWKNPSTQSSDTTLIGIHPWRPAGGTNGSDFSLISRFDPTGSVVFLPEGMYQREDFASMRRSENSGGDQEYFEFLKTSLFDSLNAAEDGKVNVFHFTIHPGEFRGNPARSFEVIDDFLTNVVDPLVASGKIRWATFSEMAETYEEWELENLNTDMR